MDIDDKVAFLSELFPNKDLELILNSLLTSDCDLEKSIKLILDQETDENFEEMDANAFNHFTATFPDIEIETIEAFLLINDSEKDFDSLKRDFVKQLKSPKPRDLKMKLSDFNSLLRTSRELEMRKYQTTTFNFTFLENDQVEYEKCEHLSGLNVREMASKLQTERIENFQRAASSFRSGNLTGKTSAQYYSEEGHILESRVLRLNRIAAEKIVRERNEALFFKRSDTHLDLHYLTVPESELITCSFLSYHEGKQTPSVQIITGRGNHSGGTCKLTTNIWNLLRKQKKKFSFDGIATFTNKEYFNECIELEREIRTAAIFSANEDSSDLNPTHIKYIIVYFMIAVIFESFQNDRLENLKQAKTFYLNFISLCLQYNLTKKEFSENSELSRYFLEDKNSDDSKEERLEKWLKNVTREVKIDRMKRILSLKRNNIPQEAEEDEKQESEFEIIIWRDWIECCILISLDKLGLLLREIELLESGDDLKDVQPLKSTTEAITTKIEKPFKLVNDRKSIASDAFKYGHTLPTMTINEYLELEQKRGNTITGGGASSAIKKEIDEDDEVVMELNLRKAREFDEYKDMYSRGSGNTYNRS